MKGRWALLSVGLLLAAAMARAGEAIPVAPGTFVSEDDDGATVTTTLTRPYLLAVHAVTIDQYMTYLLEMTGPDTSAVVYWRSTQGCSDVNCPASNVSFDDALRYANWLSERDGLQLAYELSGDRPRWHREANGWRLPTEAEWQLAAMCEDGCRADQRDTEIVHVTAAPLNDLGLAGMLDDHLEWCWDGYQRWRRPVLVDPVGDDPAGRRVIRGAGGEGREWAAPGFRAANLGFRLARTPSASSSLDSLLARQRRAVAERRHRFLVQAAADSLRWRDRERRDAVREVGQVVVALGGLSVYVGWQLFADEESSESARDVGLDLALTGMGAAAVGGLIYLAAGRDMPPEEALRRAGELVAAPRLAEGRGLGVRVPF